MILVDDARSSDACYAHAASSRRTRSPARRGPVDILKTLDQCKNADIRGPDLPRRQHWQARRWRSARAARSPENCAAQHHLGFVKTLGELGNMEACRFMCVLGCRISGDGGRDAGVWSAQRGRWECAAQRLGDPLLSFYNLHTHNPSAFLRAAQAAVAVVTLAFGARREDPGDEQPSVAEGVLTSWSEGPLAIEEYLAAVDLARAAARCVAVFANASLEKSLKWLA